MVRSCTRRRAPIKMSTGARGEVAPVNRVYGATRSRPAAPTASAFRRRQRYAPSSTRDTSLHQERRQPKREVTENLHPATGIITLSSLFSTSALEPVSHS